MLCLVSFACAEQQSLGIFKKGECINLIQVCSNCSYNNITSILYPNSTIALTNVEMTKQNTVYNYTFCSTNALGNYLVYGVGDDAGIITIWGYDLKITSDGFEEMNNSTITFIIIIIGLILSLGGYLLYNLWKK